MIRSIAEGFDTARVRMKTESSWNSFVVNSFPRRSHGLQWKWKWNQSKKMFNKSGQHFLLLRFIILLGIDIVFFLLPPERLETFPWLKTTSIQLSNGSVSDWFETFPRPETTFIWLSVENCLPNFADFLDLISFSFSGSIWCSALIYHYFWRNVETDWILMLLHRSN